MKIISLQPFLCGKNGKPQPPLPPQEKMRNVEGLLLMGYPLSADCCSYDTEPQSRNADFILIAP